MDLLFNFHTRLKERYQSLAAQRPAGSVFILEHGLNVNADELKDLTEVLRKEIRLNDGHIDKRFDSHYFPFLVAATEVGYNYAGNGTDFWKKLEKSLGCNPLLNETRQMIGGWFERANHIVKPLDTPWARQFRIIAYPITNSVLPLDIRLPLLESLAEMPTAYYSKQPEEIAQFLRKHSESQHYRRYRNWLFATPVIGQLAQALISEIDTSPVLTSDTLNRIRRDMEQDKINGIKLRQLRNKIRHSYQKWTQAEKLHPASHKIAPKLTYYGRRLFLKRKENGEWILEGQLPESVTAHLRQDKEFVNTLRSGHWQPFAWECFQIKPAAFLQQERFVIESQSWNKINLPFIKITGNKFDDKITELLESIRFKFEVPALFCIDDENGYHPVSKITSDSGIVACILKSSNDTEYPDGITKDKSSPSGFTVLHIDTAILEALDWARNKGITVTEKQHWSWIVPFGQVNEGEKQITILQNDPVFLNIPANHPISVVYHNEPLELASGIIELDDLTAGYEIIDIGNEKWSIEVNEKTDSIPLFSAELQGEQIVDSLRDRSLALSVDSSQPFVNVRYTLTLSNADNIQTAYSDQWDSFPQRSSLFRQAFSKNDFDIKTRFWQLLRSQQDLKLALTIENIFQKEWVLESVNHGIWWENIESELPLAVSDGEEVAAEEILHKENRNPIYLDDWQLFRAVEKNGKPIHRAATVLKCSQTISLSNRVLNLPERKLRQISDTKNGIGLENVVDDILAFRQVQTESFIAEMQRQRILDELEDVFWTITCGERWTERLMMVNGIDIKDCFIQSLKKLIREKLDWGTKNADKHRIGVSEKIISDELLTEKCRNIEGEIYNIFPDFWTTLYHKTKSVEERLSTSVFEILESILKENTGWENLNGYIRQDDWDSCFNDFTEKIYGRELTTLIYPSNVGAALFEDFNTDWSLKSAVEHFEKYQKKLSGNPYQQFWNTDIIRNVLAVFLNPSAFEPIQKVETLRVMLLDRQSMWCLSFLCWRKRQMEKIREVFDNV
ncbi:MAG: hypothetical protein LBQ50_10920 [Planctomycetaceae bacterium]|jgi:hypothetical protein|nr:hypothetical protein [Planctomycetaceae bacterium]